MQDKSKETICPICKTPNSTLLTHCRVCGTGLEAMGLMRERVEKLEQAGAQFLALGDNVQALRAYSVLLEYRPDQPRYLKGLAQACIGLNAFEEANDILNGLMQRLRNDHEVVTLKHILAEKRAV